MPIFRMYDILTLQSPCMEMDKSSVYRFACRIPTVLNVSSRGAIHRIYKVQDVPVVLENQIN